MIRKLRSSFSYALAALVILMLLPGIGRGQVVISQVYGGGGNSGTTLKNDFIEIFNRGSIAVDITGWSVQYASSTGSSWTVTPLTAVSLAPGQYYLIQEAAGTGGTVDLPTPDVTGSIALSGTNCKVALVNTTTPLSGACPAGYVDLVGIGSANCFEGTAAAPVMSNTTAVIRASGGCTDANQNSTDFAVGVPTPRNTLSPTNVCATNSTATPTFNPIGGNYYSAQSVTLSCTTGSSSIYYTTDGSDPDNVGNGTLYSTAIPVSATITIKAKAYATGYDPSSIASAVYTFPTINDVADIATLHAGTLGTTVYRLTGEAILTYQNSATKQKFIQDATGAILIYDNAGTITSSYNLYDGITGIYGTLADYNGMLEFIPVLNTDAASSTGNVIVPEERTLASLTSADQAKLIKVINASLDYSTGNFLATAQNINVTQDVTTLTMRTIANTDYSSTAIPTVAQNITCLVGQYIAAMQISPRSLADFENYVPADPTLTVSPATLTGFTYVQGSGPSAEQSFTVEGINLTNDISIAATTDYEISTGTGGSFAATDPIILTQSGGTVNSTTIYVRLKSGLVVADYNSEVINITSSPADAKTVTCSGSVSSTPLVSVTFQINMVNETVSADGVHIAGSFNDWDPAATLMSNGGSGDLYSVTLLLNSTIEYQFKYVNGNAWGSEELVPEACLAPSTTNRYEVIGVADYSIDPVCFSSCVNCPLEITFKVNMQSETVSGDGVYLAGDFTDWGTGAILMTANGTTWSATVPLQESSYHEYKFVNGNPNTTGLWEVLNGPCVGTDVYHNRFYTTPTANTTLDLVCFNSCDACPLPQLVITEVMRNPSAVTDALGEWFEMYNAGSSSVNINGFVISDLDTESHTINNGGPLVINAGSYMVLGDNANFSTNGGVNVDYQYSSFTLSNSVDEIVLSTSDATVIDQIIYDGGAVWPAPIGKSMTLNPGFFNATDNNFGYNWYEGITPYGAGDLGTPGAANDYRTTIWTGATNTDWATNTNWSPNFVPDAGTDAVIPVVATSYPTISAAATCHNITITSGASLIDENNYLDVSGTAIVNRTITDAANDKWHLFISPINESVQATAASCFNGAYVDGYNEANGAWERLATDDFVTSSQGYSINYLTGSRDLVFPGTLKTSPVAFSNLSYTGSDPTGDYGSGWHLVGNPYTCCIDPALCSVPTGMNAFAYVWNGGNYITPSIGSTGVPGTIASLQGFFVRTTGASNSLTLANAAKVHGGTFYKNSSSVPQMLSLSIEGNNYSDKTYVRFNPEATANFDQAFDAYKRAGLDAAPQLYSLLPDEKAAVNTLPGYIDTPNVSLGLKVGAEALYTINAVGFDSFESSLPIHLNDLKLGITQDLKLNPVYSFTAAPGDAENRFTLSFASVTALDKQDRSGINIAAANGIIRITHNAPVSGTVYLYSVSGQLLATSKLNAGETTLRSASNGVFIVKVVTGKTTNTQKMVVVK